jgi:hypothetical protein
LKQISFTQKEGKMKAKRISLVSRMVLALGVMLGSLLLLAVAGLQVQTAAADCDNSLAAMSVPGCTNALISDTSASAIMTADQEDAYRTMQPTMTGWWEYHYIDALKTKWFAFHYSPTSTGSVIDALYQFPSNSEETANWCYSIYAGPDC